MPFSSFPWHRPQADPRTRRAEPLVGVGHGNRPAPPEPRSPGAVFALTVGVIVPLAIGVLVMTGLPAPLQIALVAAACVAVIVALLRSRAARRRARLRAEARAATRSGSL